MNTIKKFVKSKVKTTFQYRGQKEREGVKEREREREGKKDQSE